MGYDLSNYEEVYEPFGTVADTERLIKKAHQLDIRVLLDLVINHTSDQHAWLKESMSVLSPIFMPEQLDLNWEDRECRKAIYESAMHL